MKVQILSDLHLEFGPLERTPVVADVVVLAGDVHSPARRAVEWASERFAGTPVIYVLGNHEHYDQQMDKSQADARAAAAGTNVRVLDAEECVIHGVRFLGATLWTDFEVPIDTPVGPRSDATLAMRRATNLLNDYALIRWTDRGAEPETWRAVHGRKLTAEDTRQIHQEHRAWLLERLHAPFDGPTVVVTHHPPSRESLAPRYASDWTSGAFVNDLPVEFFAAPVLWIHGHTHDSFDYLVGGCRVICNPRGYVNWSGRTENVAFDPRLVVEVPSDGESTPTVEPSQ